MFPTFLFFSHRFKYEFTIDSSKTPFHHFTEDNFYTISMQELNDLEQSWELLIISVRIVTDVGTKSKPLTVLFQRMDGEF